MAEPSRDRAFDHVVVFMFENRSFDNVLGRRSQPVVTLDTPMPPEEWTDVVAQPVPFFDTKVVPLDEPLSGLGRTLFIGLLALGKKICQSVPDIAPDTAPP